MAMLFFSHPRKPFIVGFIGCAILMVTALYLQHQLELEPCPLCIVQRVIVIVLGLVMLITAIVGAEGKFRKISGGIMLIISLAGIIVAGRHVWLQHLPADQIPECGPGLEYMMEVLPWQETLSMVFRGSGECAEVQWTFLALSIPEWTLIIFIFAALFSCYVMISKATR